MADIDMLAAAREKIAYNLALENRCAKIVDLPTYLFVKYMSKFSK